MVNNPVDLSSTMLEDPFDSTNESKSQLLFADATKEACQAFEKQGTDDCLDQESEKKKSASKSPTDACNKKDKYRIARKNQISVNLDSTTTTEAESDTDEGISVRRRLYRNKEHSKDDHTTPFDKLDIKSNTTEKDDASLLQSTDNAGGLFTEHTSEFHSKNSPQNVSQPEVYDMITSLTEFSDTPSVKVKYQRKRKRSSNTTIKSSSIPKANDSNGDKENINPHDNTASNEHQDVRSTENPEANLVTPIRIKSSKKATSSDHRADATKTKTRTSKKQIDDVNNQTSTPTHTKRGKEKSNSSITGKQTPVPCEVTTEKIETLPRKRRKSSSVVNNVACVTPRLSNNRPDIEQITEHLAHVTTPNGSKRWSCSHCTYLNTPRAKKCTICFKHRLPVATLKSMVPSPIMAGDGGVDHSRLKTPPATNTKPASKSKSAMNFENQIVSNRGKNYLVHVLTTGLKNLQWQELQRSLDLLPQSDLKLTIDDGHGFDETVTHVVTMADENYICPRTLKYLCGVLVGKWLVNHNWIVDSITANQWLNEQSYEITGDTVMGVTFGPKKGRRSSKKQLPRLFSDCKFYLHGDFEVPSKIDLQKLIKLGGAKLLSRKPSQKYTLDSPTKAIDVRKPIIICDAKCHINERSNMWLKDFQLCTSTWLFNCISCYKLLDRDLPHDGEP
ncbi:hypothetical protein K7432_007117 [Basidiobolus ranarum]